MAAPNGRSHTTTPRATSVHAHTWRAHHHRRSWRARVISEHAPGNVFLDFPYGGASTRAHTRSRIPTAACALVHSRSLSRSLSRSFSFILVHSHSFSFILVHSRSFPFILVHSRPFSFILINSRSFSFILVHSRSFSFILSLSFIYVHSRSFSRLIWFIPVWSRLASFGLVWSRFRAPSA